MVAVIVVKKRVDRVRSPVGTVFWRCKGRKRRGCRIVAKLSVDTDVETEKGAGLGCFEMSILVGIDFNGRDP